MRLLDRLPRIADIALSGARRAGSLALPAARRVAEPLQRRRRGNQRGGPEQPTAATATTQSLAGSAGAAAPAAPAPARGAPVDSAPEHVDRDAVVVAESADPGADGVGPQIHVDEPWDGYDELDAQQVADQLADASAGMLAVVRLYESTHRDRAAVIDEIDRRLAALSG